MKIESDVGDLELLPEVFRAVDHFAERHRRLVLAAFSELGLSTSVIESLPRALILEIAALAQLREWEDSGLRDQLQTQLPGFQKAKIWLAQRIRNEPERFERIEGAELSERVLHAWMRRVSWSGIGDADCELTMGDFDEQAFVDALADFVWQHRHDLLTDGKDVDRG